MGALESTSTTSRGGLLLEEPIEYALDARVEVSGEAEAHMSAHPELRKLVRQGLSDLAVWGNSAPLSLDLDEDPESGFQGLTIYLEADEAHVVALRIELSRFLGDWWKRHSREERRAVAFVFKYV
ncbi:hypothetical protein BH11ARM2_BH11ARM2_25530 [soil metagenome]